jgi:hypothetical protein
MGPPGRQHTCRGDPGVVGARAVVGVRELRDDEERIVFMTTESHRGSAY